MRDIHSKCDGVRCIKTFYATLGVHALDGLEHTRVLAVEQLHALLHNVQRRDNCVMNNGRTCTSQHISKHLVAMPAPLECLFCNLVCGKIQRMAGYCRTAHGSDAAVQRQQSFLGNRMPRSVRDVAVPASAVSRYEETQRCRVGWGRIRWAEGQRHLQARFQSVKGVHAAVLSYTRGCTSNHVAVGRESNAWLPQSHRRLLHVRYRNIRCLAPNLRAVLISERAGCVTRVFGALRGDWSARVVGRGTRAKEWR
jgi:hypothetical protein